MAARLAAALSLALMFVGAVAIGAQVGSRVPLADTLLVLIAAVFFMAAYFFSRSPRAELAAWFLLLPLFAALAAIAFANQNPLPLGFLSLVVLIASLLASLRVTVFVYLFALAASAVFAARFPFASRDGILNTAFIILSVGALALLSAFLRKRGEEQVAESEGRYRSLVENALVGVYQTDLEGNVLFVNPELARMLGFDSPREMIGTKAIGRYKNPQDRARLLETLKRDGYARNFDVELLTREGQPRAVLMSAAIKDGTLTGMARDITERKRAEEELRESEERFSTAFFTSPVAQSIVVKESNEIIAVNDASCRLFEYRREELIGAATAKLNLWENPADRLAALEELRQTGRLLPREVSVRIKSGEFRAVIAAIEPISWKNIPCYITSLYDITERKRAEEALRRSEADLAEAQRMAKLGSWSFNVATNEVRWSEELYRVFDVEKADFGGMYESFLSRVHSDDKPRVLETNRKAREDGEPFQIEYRISTRDGQLRYISESGYALKNEAGGVAALFGTAQDITERKRAEERLIQSEERYRSTLDNMLEGCQIIGFDWRYLYINAEAERHNNRPSSELLGQRYMDMWPGIEATPVFAVIERCMNERASQRLENEFTFPDGSVGWFELNIQPVPEGILILSADITERKRVEADRMAREVAEQANRAKSEFLSRMSHELRTPLNAILGFAQLLQMDKLEPKQARGADQIYKSGRHLLDLVNEVLDISRIEAGRLTVSPEPIKLKDAVNETLDLIRPMAEARRLSLSLKIPSSSDVFVLADRQRLKQVLLNLLSNAVKYNRAGGAIAVTASLCMDGHIRLQVRDDGEGIPPEKMERLFVPFDRLDTSHQEGTGLGLALSKGLIEAMGGRIGAESAVGEGSVFWIELKLVTNRLKEIIMAEVDDNLTERLKQGGGLVLYVEDNLANVNLVEAIMERLPGVKLITAMQGRIALDLAKEHQPNLILLDLHLPDIHGADVLKWLKAEPATQHIPVVIISADAMTPHIHELLEQGAAAYLTKPIDVKEFLKVIEEHI